MSHPNLDPPRLFKYILIPVSKEKKIKYDWMRGIWKFLIQSPSYPSFFFLSLYDQFKK